MKLSVPDICDEYFDELVVLPPLFTDFGKRRIFSGEVVTVKCFEDNSRIKEYLENILKRHFFCRLLLTVHLL